MAFMGGREKRKVVISGMLGNGLEWYDYALYGHMSIVFSQLFFPAGDLGKNLILTLLIFAAGFVSRPIGAVFFGRMGDKYGRKKALTMSMIMMAIPTGCIGLLPTYEAIGIAAPILLTLIRVLQGFSLGGAYSGSISYVVEHAPADQRSTVGSVIKLSLVIGFLFGSLVSTLVASLLNEADFYSWGWRLPFFLGVGIGFVGFYIRNHGEESPVYEKAKKDGALSKSPLKDTFTKHPLKMMQAFMLYIFVTIPFYVIAIYMIAYSKRHLGLSEDDSLLINSLAMGCMLIMIYPAARLADKIGRKRVLLVAILAMLAVTYPAFNLMQTDLVSHTEMQLQTDATTGNTLLDEATGEPLKKEVVVIEHAADFMSVLIGQCIIALIIGWYLGPIPATLVEMFPTSIRYTGMSLAYNLCAIFGGFTPSIAEWMIRGTHNNMSIMWLIIGAGMASFISISLYKDRWREPLQA
jgi:MHS family proline/betaine transporter-like MFS transporter